MKNGLYQFCAEAFGWPSSRTVSEYDSLGGNQADGICYESLKQLHEDNMSAGGDNIDDEWFNMYSLSFDAMHCADGIKSNMHTNEIVCIDFNPMRTDIILKGFEELAEESKDSGNQKESTRAK